MSGFLHPVIRSILLQFWIAYDHPFVDGNGRTARALFYWSMLRHGFWLAEFFSISHEILKEPKNYYRALRKGEPGLRMPLDLTIPRRHKYTR